MHIYVILVSCTAPSMHIYVIPVACTAPSMHLHNIYMAQSFPSEGLVTSLRSLYFSMTEQGRATGQAEELVPIQRLSIRIQEYWWHWAYQNKWRRCDGCWTWGMLFSDFDASYTAMHQHPMTTVIEGVRSVTKHDPKHMCKACNAHKNREHLSPAAQMRRPEESRMANDGCLYTQQQFVEYYGDPGYQDPWNTASLTTPPSNVARLAELWGGHNLPPRKIATPASRSSDVTQLTDAAANAPLSDVPQQGNQSADDTNSSVIQPAARSGDLALWHTLSTSKRIASLGCQ
jgi:hypothetical protein